MRNAAIRAEAGHGAFRLKAGLPTSLFVLLFAALISAAFGTERFPPPDLGPDYIYPHSSQAPARTDWRGWVDVGVLAAGLGAAAWIAFRRRSRRAMAWLSALAIAYFGFYRKGCVCPIGAIQNVAQALFDPTYSIPLIVILFFTLPLLFAIVFGRVFCGGVCPLGAVQDIVMIKPLRVPAWLDRGLRMIPYFYLGLAVLFAAASTTYVICKYDPFVGFFRFSARFSIWMWSAAVLALSFFVGRPYCRFLCPYGALLGLFSRFSLRRITTTPDRCIQCGLCDDSCAFEALGKGVRKEDEAR
ncbi:MAG: 4Fe-4S binding protein [Candidatus Sumerlaeota bacterium]|nr:4Fe-4S binding protein [Candidatus Sumerlaeota bacterium]